MHLPQSLLQHHKECMSLLRPESTYPHYNSCRNHHMIQLQLDRGMSS